jgi:O-antigen/teichoic acid export membrane protein
MLHSTANQSVPDQPVSQLNRWMSRLHATLRGSKGTVAGFTLADCLIVGGTNFLTILLVGRIAGPDELGLYSLVMTVFYLLLAAQEALVTVPYTIFGVRLKGRLHLQYASASLYQSIAWSACGSAILALAAAVVLFVSHNASLARVVGVFAMVLPLWLFREFGRRFLFAHMAVGKIVVTSFAGSFSQLVAICALAYVGKLSAATALVALGIGGAISGLGSLWFNRAAFRFSAQRWSHFARKNWVFGRWVLASHAAQVFGANTMPWLIVFWLGPTGTGVYAACDAILRFANPIIVSLSNVMTPLAASGHNNGGKAELRRIVSKATALLSLFLLAFCLALLIGGKWLLQRSFGGEYAGYWGALVVLGIAQFVAKLALAPSRALLVIERANINLYAEGTGLIASLIAATVLIPFYGVLGAAVAQLIGSLALATITVGAYQALMRDDVIDAFPLGSATPSMASAGGVSK